MTEVTDTNSDQSRPRHLTTPEMIKRLDPISLDRTIGLHEYNDGRIFESSADVVKVTFKGSRRTNYVLYASDRSDNNLLKKSYQLWNTYKEKIRRLLNTMPLEALIKIKDDLAGGCYVRLRDQRTYQKHTGRPYLRQSSINAEVARLFKLHGKILGLISNAIAEILPEVYEENIHPAMNNFAYPSPANVIR